MSRFFCAEDEFVEANLRMWPLVRDQYSLAHMLIKSPVCLAEKTPRTMLGDS